MLSAAVEKKQDGALQVAPLFLLFVCEGERAQRVLANVRASLHAQHAGVRTNCRTKAISSHVNILL